MIINTNIQKMSDEIDVSVQEIEEYAENVISTSRLMKTPRNSSSDFSREKYDEPEIVMAAMNSAANAAANVHSPRSNSVTSFQLDHADPDLANNRVSFNLNQQTPASATPTNGNANSNDNTTNGHQHARTISSRSSSRASKNRTDSQNSMASTRSGGFQNVESTSTTSSLFLTQVTLSLSLPKGHRASTSSYAPVWKYNTIRKTAATGRSENGSR